MSSPNYSAYVSDYTPHPSHPSAARNSQSPLTGHDPDFLDQLLPPFNPSSHGASPYPFTEVHFDETYRPSPSPSPSPPISTFLDTILNPAGLDHNRYSPFVYQPPPPQLSFPAVDNMPPATRARPQTSQRPARLPNGYVDLTATPHSPPQTRKRESPSPGPSAKRQKRGHGTTGKQGSTEPVKVEEVDLTDDKQPVQEVLQKQREDAVKAQTRPEEKPTTFNTFTCVICMDNPTDLTATACGHLFCHTCLMEALIAGENRTGPGEPKRSQCPVCRKSISRSKTTDIIPLLLKKGLSTQPRKKAPSSTTNLKV
ncbi:Nn.00g003530.m01.CDS01 [Neocucurbitaria sp. VM-36]